MYPEPLHFENGSELRFRCEANLVPGAAADSGPDVGLSLFVTDRQAPNDRPKSLVVPRATVMAPETAELEELLAAMRATLRSQSVEIVHQESDREVAQNLAAMLILTVRVLKHPGAEYAIRSVTGRSEPAAADEPVLQFYRERMAVRAASSPDAEFSSATTEEPQRSATVPGPGPVPSAEPVGATEVALERELEPVLPQSAPSVGARPDVTITDDVPADAPVAVATPPKAPGLPTAPTSDFQPSRVFTIRNKLLFITSAIIITAMVTMIVVASVGFRQNSRIQVEEKNFVQADTLGSKADFEFQGALSGAELLMAGGGAAALRQNYFARNQQILFAGRAVRLPTSFAFTQKYYNDARLAIDDLSHSQVDTLFTLHGDRFLKAFNGASVVENISPGFPHPVLGIARPVGTAGDVLIVVLDIRDFLKAFGGADATQSPTDRKFLVNASGEVLAHADLKLVRARGNIASLEIVKKLLSAKVASQQGQSEYKDELGVTWIGAYKKLDFGNLGVVSAARKDFVFQSVERLQRNNIYILVIAVNVALLTIFFFARALTVPIRRLVEATQLIEAGDYHVNIPPTTRDEIGLLSSSFGNMARGLDERERMKDAFGKFVNKEIAERVLRGEVMLGGEKKHCAIFFSDLRGFTAMSEGMLPEEVVDFLNRYFTGMVRCVNQTHGIVDKFIGDAIMAHWGAVVSHGNDTENAINAALMMRTTLIELNRNRPSHMPLAKMGCGINTGNVIAGQIGSDERLEFTVIGDAVNLASRIESLNKPFGTDLLISSDALAAVADLYNVAEMPAIKVKGKSEPQHIYAVLGRRDDPESPRDIRAVRSLVGIEFDDAKMPDAVEGEEVKYEILDEKKK